MSLLRAEGLRFERGGRVIFDGVSLSVQPALVLATHDPEVAVRCDHVLSLARHLSAHGQSTG